MAWLWLRGPASARCRCSACRWRMAPGCCTRVRCGDQLSSTRRFARRRSAASPKRLRSKLFIATKSGAGDKAAVVLQHLEDRLRQMGRTKLGRPATAHPAPEPGDTDTPRRWKHGLGISNHSLGGRASRPPRLGTNQYPLSAISSATELRFVEECAARRSQTPWSLRQTAHRTRRLASRCCGSSTTECRSGRRASRGARRDRRRSTQYGGVKNCGRSPPCSRACGSACPTRPNPDGPRMGYPAPPHALAAFLGEEVGEDG